MGSTDRDETIGSYGTDIGKRTNSWTRLRDWFLVEADRLVVAGTISLATFVGLLVLNELGLIAFVNDDSITRLAGGMIAGTFSLVTLVVSINQLILSREFTAAGESESQIEGVVDFRQDVADVAEIPAAPASPTRLLEVVVHAIGDRAEALSDAVADHDASVADPIDAYAAEVRESADRIDDTLEHTTFGTFRAVSAAIGYDDAWHLYAARHIQGRYGEQYSREAQEAMEELIDAIELFSVAREHFKTTYLQRELTRFSQLTIYCGVPAVLSAMILGFVYADPTGPTIAVGALPWVASALVTIVISPLSLLTAYILRTATVTRRTVSTGPMLPQKDPDEGPFEVEAGDGRGTGSGTGTPSD
ncbi:hypothetical protein [Natrarchaeobaculum aegyptiacum]|uniref:Uncharacterized protein n=1 Tax=Natrarchaeobaculum aegyptiacum TaxID=745377 RepID=A0A2Z2HVE3_9EURY|nr:hypothetical protein [Natrarchaeobaculum aegyptiacum]ARS90145.1 hypothetical protein B1756_10660 [Natrarchaeobaculum aegyptiacum]